MSPVLMLLPALLAAGPPPPPGAATAHVIPEAGTPWAAVVRTEAGGRIDVIDVARMPEPRQLNKVPGRTNIYLNQGVPAAFPLAPEVIAGLAAANAARTRRIAALDRGDERVRLLSEPDQWLLAVTEAARLDHDAASALNAAIAAEKTAEDRWAAGDLRVQVCPVALVEVGSFPADPDEPRVERNSPAQAGWLRKRPEVWRYRGRDWALVEAGTPYFLIYADL